MPANRKPKAWNLKPQMTAAPELWEGCVFACPFWENVGSAVNDVSGYGSHGILTGGKWAAGQHGTALSLSGASYVSTAENKTLLSFVKNTSIYTFAAWLKVGSFNAGAGETVLDTTNLSSINAGFFWAYEDRDGVGDNEMRMFVTNGGGSVVYDIRSNNNAIHAGWNHVVVVGDGSTVTYFVDGQAAGGGSAVANNAGDNTFNLRVGAAAGNNLSIIPFNGYIEDVRIYNRALSEHEIQKLYKDSFAMLRPAGV